MPCHHAIKPHRACAREYASTDVPAVVAEVGCCASRSQESHGKWHAAPAMRAWRVCPRAPWRRALYVTGGSSPRGLGDDTLQLRPVPFFLPIAYHRRSPPNHTGSGTRHPRCARGGCARACDAVAPRAVRNWGFVIKGARRQNPPIASLLPNCIPPPHATTPPLHRGRRGAGCRGRPRGRRRHVGRPPRHAGDAPPAASSATFSVVRTAHSDTAVFDDARCCFLQLRPFFPIAYHHHPPLPRERRDAG